MHLLVYTSEELYFQYASILRLVFDWLMLMLMDLKNFILLALPFCPESTLCYTRTGSFFLGSVKNVVVTLF